MFSLSLTHSLSLSFFSPLCVCVCVCVGGCVGVCACVRVRVFVCRCGRMEPQPNVGQAGVRKEKTQARKERTQATAQRLANETPWTSKPATFGGMPPKREDVMRGEDAGLSATYTHFCYTCKANFRCVPNIPHVVGITVPDPFVYNCRCLKHCNYRMDMTFCSNKCFWEFNGSQPY